MAAVALITDSTCSLPDPIRERYSISQVPLTVKIDGRTFSDPCDAQQSLKLFESDGLSKSHDVDTRAPTSMDFERAIIRKIKEGASLVVVQTVNRTQGETYNNANIALSSIQKKIRAKGVKASVKLMDSRTVFAGQALMATATMKQMSTNRDMVEVKRLMNNLSPQIQTYILPKSPLLAFERSSKRNDKSVGWGQAFIADKIGVHPIVCNANDSSQMVAKVFSFKKAARKLFKQALCQIEKGLTLPYIAINYAGDLSDLDAFPEYLQLREQMAKRGIEPIFSVMSIAGGIYTSVGSISLALASENTQWYA